jgi:PAS domain S-box-containing protein
MVTGTQVSIEELEKKIAFLEAENKSLRHQEFSILRELPEIVFILDKNENLVFLNNICLDKFRLTKLDFDNKIQLKDIVTSESLYHLRKLYISHQNKEIIHAHQITGKRNDGTEFPFTAVFSKLIENGKFSGFIGIGFDLTERIKVENQLKEANLAKMKFLSIIAHDLRNPFNSLVGFSTLLLSNYDRYSSEKIKDYINFMSKAANQGHQLLENLLNWAMANTKKIEMHPTTININYTINETVNLLAANASKKEITIEQHVPDYMHAYADQNMIRTVSRNLISNALKFTPRGGAVKIIAHDEVEYIVIEFMDNGVGIAPEKLPNLFSLSNDYSTLGTEKETGTGLGLILCYEFILLNNGLIEVDSKPGMGSTFRIKIPRYKTA